jgi:hypothetical protein
MNDRVIFRITDATVPLFREETVLDLVEEPPVVPRVIQLGRDRGGLDSTRRPLLPAARDGDALPLPSIFS